MNTNYTPKRQVKTSLYNNRKILPSRTGNGTIRELDSGKYVIIVHFQHWKKSHSIDCYSGIPFESPHYYDSFDDAKHDMVKYLLNIARKPKLKAPLAKTDDCYDRIATHELELTY